jgi:hypothetical protein
MGILLIRTSVLVVLISKDREKGIDAPLVK